MTDRLPVVREEEYIRCCDRPPPVYDCCGCDGPDGSSLMASEWEIQESLEGMYSIELSPGVKQAWGCENFVNARRLIHGAGPTYPSEPDRTGDCFWYSLDSQPGKCCQFGCDDSEPWSQSVTAYMGCYKVDAVPPTDPVYHWYLDCGCDDLWCGDSSQWGSLEDCLEYDTNCACCNEEGSYSATEEECNYLRDYYVGLGLTCSECEEVETTPGSPGHPAYVDHVAGLSGPCACARQYVFLDPLNPRCKDMLGSVGGTSADLPDFDCDGCNTYYLVQYVALDIEGNPAPGYPCSLGATHICNGSDLACTDCCEGWGHYYCLGYPATLTICPASTRSDLPTGSVGGACDVLCCTEEGEVVEEVSALAVSDTPVSPMPPDTIWWEIAGTVTGGFLIRDDDGLYKGGLAPFFLSLDKEKKELNGKPITMYSDEVFWGTTFLGDKIGWQIIVMA